MTHQCSTMVDQHCPCLRTKSVQCAVTAKWAIAVLTSWYILNWPSTVHCQQIVHFTSENRTIEDLTQVHYDHISSIKTNFIQANRMKSLEEIDQRQREHIDKNKVVHDKTNRLGTRRVKRFYSTDFDEEENKWKIFEKKDIEKIFKPKNIDKPTNGDSQWQRFFGWFKDDEHSRSGTWFLMNYLLMGIGLATAVVYFIAPNYFYKIWPNNHVTPKQSSDPPLSENLNILSLDNQSDNQVTINFWLVFGIVISVSVLVMVYLKATWNAYQEKCAKRKGKKKKYRKKRQNKAP